MPTVSEAQRRAMQAAKVGESTIGIPQSIGEEFIGVDEGGETGGQASLRETLTPLVQNPAEAFLAALMSVASEVGVLDEAFQDSTVEDDIGLQSGDAIDNELLDQQQITELISLFMAIPEPQRSELEQQIRAAVPPNVLRRLEAAVKFTQQRGGGQNVPPV